MRVAAVCLVGVAVTLCCASPAVARHQKKKPRPACQTLQKRFKDIASSAKLVVVRRGNIQRGRISACVLPRGKVRTLASWEDYAGGGSVLATAGTWVLVSFGAGNGRSLTRIEVRHNKSRLLSLHGCPPYGEDCERYGDGMDHGKAGIARNGAGAVELKHYDVDLPTDTPGFVRHPTTLHAFNPAGAFTTLSDGPVDALRVTSTQITWTLYGMNHAAPLPP